MSNNALKHIRNIGILAHIDAGKTTTTERLLFYSGQIHKMGEVHDGAATMDWMPQEQERGITITAAATSLPWKHGLIHLIDTPGHVDFTVEVERSLRVLDGAVFVLDAKEGVEPQTEAVWHLADTYSVPRLVFVNKMDRIGADFQLCLNNLTKTFKMPIIPVVWPLGQERDFIGVIDLIAQCAIYFDGEQGESIRIDQIPDSQIDFAQQKRQEIVEALVDFDDALIDDYLSGVYVTSDRLMAALRKATIAQCAVPVFCGSAYRNKGIQTLMDGIVSYLPAPTDKAEVTGEYLGMALSRKVSDDAPFSALIFKVMSDPFVGKLFYIRVYSGTLHPGNVVLNASKEKRERVSKLLSMHANSRQEKMETSAGDILAIVGLKHSTTGDTLCDLDHPIVYEAMHFPNPVIAMAIEPKTPADMEKLHQALEKLLDEDPTLSVSIHPETGQTLISGMGELHLEIIIDRLKTEFSLAIHSGSPQVSYCETLTEPTQLDYHLNQSMGQNRLEAQLALRLRPLTRGDGNRIALDKVCETLSPQQQLWIQSGIEGALLSGPIGGYPVVDVCVEVLALQFKSDSFTEVALKTISSLATAEGTKKGHVSLLEPFCSVVIHVPESTTGDVLDDLRQRSGLILEVLTQNGLCTVRATAPLSKMFGYATALRSKTQGRGNHSMQFSHYDVCY